MNKTNDITIIGYGCRLPGANSVGDFWDVLKSRRCVVTSVKPDRWNLDRFGHPDIRALGKSYTWAAGQLDDVWAFDPGFFGISPREAMQMDPQQRILLEVIWDAIEDAGLVPSEIAGTEVGVFVGASGLDHVNMLMLDFAAADAQLMTGNTLSILSNRISHIYDLRGPSFTLDTACSSSLVALHEACEAIKAGRIDTAIVAGVNLLLSPFPFVGFSRAAMLSPTGLCRAFDAAGDGYVRSEGCVALVLQRASVAEDNNLTAHVSLVASGINANGRTNGLSLPSSEAQAKLLNQVYSQCEADPNDLAFIEAHGTGTRVGDPLEARALGEALGHRRDQSLPIGSVKTNIGHLEAGSGIAGLLKATLALEHELLPASLHLETPNPDILFDEWNLDVATNNLKLDTGVRGQRLAGVNSFGFGGANAHVILRDVAEVEKPADLLASAPLVLTARSAESLRKIASTAADALEAGADPAELANGAAYRRDWHSHRAVILGSKTDERLAAIKAFLDDEQHLRLATGEARATIEQPVFVYSGNGAQWAGMGRAAYKADVAFRNQFAAVDRQFMRVSGWSLLSILFSEDIKAEIDRTEVAQPLLFAIQVALTTALKEGGITPSAVIGHSVGEVAAAWAADHLSLDDAVRVIHARSTHQEMIRYLGTMAAVLQPENLVREALTENDFSGVTLATVNSPRSLTISGPTEGIDDFARVAKKRRWAVRKLDLDYPFHCGLVDPIREPLAAALKGLKPRRGSIPFYSTVHGEVTEGTALDGEYWWANVRQPVMFMKAVQALLVDGHSGFIELGPRPILTNYLRDTARAENQSVSLISTLDTNDADHDNPMDAVVARAMANGVCVGKNRRFGPKAKLRSPGWTYPWNHQSYHFESTDEALHYLKGHQFKLVGYRLRDEHPVWTNHIDLDLMPWLADHMIEDAVVFPATGFIEMAVGAGTEFNNGEPLELREFDILQPMILDETSTHETRIAISPETRTVEISSRPRLSNADWTLHAKGRLAQPTGAEAVGRPDGFDTIDTRLRKNELYDLIGELGLPYGPAFQRAKLVETFSDSTARVHLTSLDEDSPLRGAFNLEPTVLDAAFHGFFALLLRRAEVRNHIGGVSFLPVRLRRLVVDKPASDIATADLIVTRADSLSLVANMRLYDADGVSVARVEGIRFRRVDLHRARNQGGFIYRTDAVRLPEPWDRNRVTSQVLDALATVEAAEPCADDEGWLLTEAAARVIAEISVQQVVGSTSDPIDVAALQRQGRLAAESLPLFERLLDLLVSVDRASHDGSTWRFETVDDIPPVEVIIETLLAEHPSYATVATILSRVTKVLPSLLQGGLVDGAHEIFSGDIWEHYKTGTAWHTAISEACLEVLARSLTAFPGNRPVDILFIGADYADLARRLAGRLDLSRMRMVVADIPGQALERARTTLDQLPAVSVQPLEKPNEIGATFDVVVGVSALGHAAPGIPGLRALRKFGVPDGLFLLFEPEPAAFYDIIDGLGSNWWQTHYDLDARGRILAAQDWADALGQANFVDVATSSIATGGAGLNLLTASAGEEDTVSKDADERRETESTVPGPVIFVMPENGDKKLIEAARSIFEDARQSLQVLPVSGIRDGRLVVAIKGGGTSVIDGASIARSNGQIVVPTAVRSKASDQTATIVDRADLLSALLKSTAANPCPIWIVTEGGARGLTADTSESEVQAAIWGFARVAANEYPEHDIRLVDVSPNLSPSESAVRLESLLSNPGDETEIILDADGLWGLRVRPGLPGMSEGQAGDPDEADETDAIVSLEIARQGFLESLTWVRHDRPRLGPRQVEIEVAATSLNFRDVMWAQGLLPAEALEDGFVGQALGMECSGTIKAIGEDVTDLTVGDTVLTFAPACFASAVIVDAKAVAVIPETVSLIEASTIPVAFLTAYYAMIELARLSEDDTILIHGGAGGVGLAALQLAKWRGATIIATAGNECKRALLEMLGADHILDSRTLAFEDDIRRLTDGAGVDVVLNSLSGDAMERSIDLLKPFGRFLELGKRDYYANSAIGLRPFRQNLSYFGIDADQLLTHQPKLARRLLKELMELFADGTLAPLPYRLFDADQVTEAFRLMQKSGHIGKIVITPPRASSQSAVQPLELDDTRTFLIAGGLGGFGLATARWLIDQGARHIVMTSRRGVTTPEQETAISALRELGASVEGVACDITDEAAVTELLVRINSTSARLGGVLHTAMVLDDSLIDNLDRDRIERVLTPKVKGAEILDRLTRGMGLQAFVLFSSASTMVGNPGQANYVAANMYLEALARKRRGAGEAALAVAWGAIADAGYLARNQDVDAVLSQRLGRSSLSAKQALQGLGNLLANATTDPRHAALSFARIDWSSVRKELALFKAPLFTEIAASAEHQEDAGDDVMDITALLNELSPSEVTQKLGDILAGEIAHILRMTPDAIARHRALSEIGMDSLMALELRMVVEQRLGINIPLMSLSGGMSLNDLSSKIVARYVSDEKDELGQEAATLAMLAMQHVSEHVSDEDAVRAAEMVEKKAASLRDMI